LIVLPDTQVYAERHPEIFLAQARWIAENAADIGFVVHVGDVVEHNSEAEWELAKRAFSMIPVPYAIAPGNHDMGPNGDASTRDTLMHVYLESKGEPFEAGRMDNTAHLFTREGRDWIVLALEWGPRDAVVSWANETLDRHRGRSAIIVTHAYLHSDGTRADRSKPEQPWNPHSYPTASLPGGVNDGEELWTKLVSRHPNVVLVLSGHYGEHGGAARSTAIGLHGNRVHQLLSDYQLHENGGNGWLRIMEIDEARREIRVRTYSPVLDRHLEDPANAFTLDLPVKT
jgi:hypothetical protein